MNLHGLFSPSGGLIYHWRALSHAQIRWRPFRVELHRWLMKWIKNSPEIILIGPSAGYCLETDFLMNFKHIVAYDPDPVAEVLFRKRLQRNQIKLELDWISTDPFMNPKEFSQEPTPVLFCNLLGQMPLMKSNRWSENIQDLTKDRPWASFHDRLSGPLRPLYESKSFDHRLSDSEILENLYSSPRKTELVSHLPEFPLSANSEYSYFRWEIRPRRFHLIEACFQS